MAYIWQLNIIGLQKETFVCGTVLRNKPRSKHNAGSVLENLFQVIASYTNLAYKKRIIFLKMDDKEYQLKTDKNGYFEIAIPATITRDVHFLNRKKKKMKIIQEYPFLFPMKEQPYEVISDIDDTLIHSNTVSLVKRLATLLLTRAKNRKSVDSTVRLLRDLERLELRITYLSKSESNLFRLIQNIFMENQLPQGAMLLSPFLSFRRLLFSKPDNFKIDHLDRLVSKMPDKQFILLGDDSQKDISIYRTIAAKYKTRIKKVYIRQTDPITPVQATDVWKDLVDLGVACQVIGFEDEMFNEAQNILGS